MYIVKSWRKVTSAYQLITSSEETHSSQLIDSHSQLKPDLGNMSIYQCKVCTSRMGDNNNHAMHLVGNMA